MVSFLPNPLVRNPKPPNLATMKTLLSLSVVLLACLPGHALISGGEGNEEVADRGWPEGSTAVANMKSRVAYWVGPPFGGGQYHFEFREESVANFNKALELFAKIDAPKKELVVERGPKDSFWLEKGAREDDKIDARIDWMFVVWNLDTWKQLYNDPNNTFLADHPNFRKAVDPPRIHAYIGGGGKIAWDDVKVPDGITVIDKRGKPGG